MAATELKGRKPRAVPAERVHARLATMRADSVSTRAARPVYLGLTRVSTRVQAEEGHSMEEQDARLREYADRRGWELELVPVPAVSGKRISPELAEALDRLARGGAAGIVVTKLDRLTRSVQVAASIIASAQEQGWNLVMLDLGGVSCDLATPGGKALAHMVATFAEFEREQIAERVKAGFAAAARNGTKSGKPIGRPVLVSPEIASLIVAEYKEGHSFAAIADGLTEAGELSPAGGRTWQASTVRRIFNRTSKGDAA
jgi:DNA invertase Pin-like site-specific DNA recombinase